MSEHVRREMGLTLGEFFRALPFAVEGLSYRTDGSRISIAHPEGTIDITLTPVADRCIGALRVPVTLVEFTFSGLSSSGRRGFMENLDRHFQRGGG